MSDPALVSVRTLNDCGGCAGVSAETPNPVLNRPDLSAIAYRVGRHAQFKASMLAALSDSSRPALLGLRTRGDDDFTVALLDAAATMADVLSFYQERVANESYLRTATERQSVLELARLIGYELRPGVAAAAYLAFTVDQTAGAPAKVPIDVGTKVQSVPGPGQSPQTFETVMAIEARPEWNALRPQRKQPQTITLSHQSLVLSGVNTRLSPGDPLLITSEDNSGGVSWQCVTLTAVSPNKPTSGMTTVSWKGVP